MNPSDINPLSATEDEERAAVIAFLGGTRGIGGKAKADYALHDRMRKGFPARALHRFAMRCPTLVQDEAFARVLGLPTTENHGNRLTSQQSSQLWHLSTLVVTAAPIFGGTEVAERWLLRPTPWLDGRRPIDLMETPMGRRLVIVHLIRVAYGVYI